LLPDVNIYGINTVKQLLVSASLILLNTTLRILIVDQGKISNICVNFDLFVSKQAVQEAAIICPCPLLVDLLTLKVVP